MVHLRSQISECFRSDRPPDPTALVINDGFDVWDKERAVKKFAGVSSEAVYEYLANGDDSWAYYLEEWSCLTASALKYYMPAYLLYLLDTLDATDPHDEFVFFFFCRLVDIIVLYGIAFFSVRERE